MNADAVHLAGETEKALGNMAEGLQVVIVEKARERQYNKGWKTKDHSTQSTNSQLENTVAYKVLCGSGRVVREYFESPRPNVLQVGLTQDSPVTQFRKRRKNWEFHRTLSYWSIIAYIVGCCLFAVACFLGSSVMLTHVEYPARETQTEEERRKFAFVMYPFYIGSVAFTFAGYIGWFRCCNSTYSGEAGKKFFYLWPDFTTCKKKEEKIFIIKSGLYFWGGAFYCAQNMNKMVRGHRGIPGGVYGYQYITQVVLFLGIGSSLQLLGAVLELRYLQNWKRINWKDLSWWAVWINLFSCLCFSIGSLSGCVHMYDPKEASDLVNIPFLCGSIGFLIASWLYLIIFKREQWKFYFNASRGQFYLQDQFYICLYLYNLILCLCNCVYALDRSEKRDLFNILFCAFGIWLHIMLLHLTNVVCTTPQKKGWGCMHTSLRLSVLLFSVPVTLQFLQWYDPSTFNFES